MDLPVMLPVRPMLAKLVSRLPEGMVYEPRRTASAAGLRAARPRRALACHSISPGSRDQVRPYLDGWGNWHLTFGFAPT